MRDMDSVWIVEMELYNEKVYQKEFNTKDQAWIAYDKLPRNDKNYIITVQRKWRERKVA